MKSGAKQLTSIFKHPKALHESESMDLDNDKAATGSNKRPIYAADEGIVNGRSFRVNMERMDMSTVTLPFGGPTFIKGSSDGDIPILTN